MSTRTPSGERTVQLDITLVGREFKVGCKEHERAELMEAVALLDTRMREIRDGGKIAAVDRIAVMAALNLANELLRERRAPPPPAVPPNVVSANVDAGHAQRRIQSMQSAIDQVLAGQEKLF
ncbi:MAG: cell division protein ZapA [Casimicrobiaceae bacterium]